MRPYRKEKIASAIRQIISTAIVHQLSDPRIARLTTVTRVEMTSDLQVAKVFLSIPAEDDKAEQLTFAAIRHAGGYLQRQVAQGLSLRQCPELRFSIDERLKNTKRTMALLAENRRNEPELYEPVEDEEAETATGEGDRDRIADNAEGTTE